MTKKTISTSWKSPEYLKNEIRFKLLTALPSFQKDVEEIRKELKISKSGFNNDKDYKHWYEKEIINKSDRVIDSKKFNEDLRKIHSLQKKDYAEYLKQKWLLHDRVPINRMNNRTETLGKEYNLPANFYEKAWLGLCTYITRNEIRPPSNNWAIQQDSKGRKGTTKWLAIQTFAPLSKKELKDATEMLVYLQKHYFPKSIMINTRTKKQFDRDLEIFKELVLERAKKPVKRKKYSDYLSYLKLKNPQEKRQLEKLHPHCIEITFDETISREVAKKLKMTPEAVKQVLTRMRTRIKEFFGEEYLKR